MPKLIDPFPALPRKMRLRAGLCRSLDDAMEHLNAARIAWEEIQAMDGNECQCHRSDARPDGRDAI